MYIAGLNTAAIGEIAESTVGAGPDARGVSPTKITFYCFLFCLVKPDARGVIGALFHAVLAADAEPFLDNSGASCAIYLDGAGRTVPQALRIDALETWLGRILKYVI